MKKAGLYDKNRYPYNARLLQSANSSFDTRGSDVALGSGVRMGNTSRASRPSRYRETPASSDSRSQNSDKMTDFDGFSDTASKRTTRSSYKSRTVPAPLGSGYSDRSHGTISILSTDELTQGELRPSVRIVTRFAWAGFVLQMLCMLLCLVVIFSPGWGRATEDLSTDKDHRGKVFSYYGLWLRCTLQQYEEYWGDLNCRTNAVIGMEAWWTICQVFSCVYLVLSIIAFVMICFYVCRRKSSRRWPLALSHVIVSAINSLFLCTVLVLFAIKFLDDSWWCCPSGNEVTAAILFWCWYLALGALLFQVAAFAMTLTETINLRR